MYTHIERIRGHASIAMHNANGHTCVVLQSEPRQQVSRLSGICNRRVPNLMFLDGARAHICRAYVRTCVTHLSYVNILTMVGAYCTLILLHVFYRAIC